MADIDDNLAQREAIEVDRSKGDFKYEENYAFDAGIGLTPATCHRRLKRLRESGLIIKEMALVDPQFSARPLTVIIEIAVARNLVAFLKKLSQMKELSMCWAVSGPMDFVAVGHFRDIDHFREFMVAELIENEDVKHQTSAVVVDRIRFNLEMEFPVET